ncbi:MAG: ABC transporter ATP-binding protein [Hyphomicrobiaceae bacterium]
MLEADVGIEQAGDSLPRAGEPLLQVEGLSIGFRTEQGGSVRVVDNVSFEIGVGETLGLVGESGCGKSVTAQTVMRLLPSPPAVIEAGRIVFEGEDLAVAPERRMRELRGDRLAMIFQEPMTSLNPTMTVGAQVAEALVLHRGLTVAEARSRAIEGLAEVGIGSPERRAMQFPHQLSGGLRQRVMIAMALACRPRLLIADEPTTALDVTVQAQLLELIGGLKRDLGLAILLITHDLGVVSQVAERIAVMYSGTIVEAGPAAAILASPRHPYTAGLLASLPSRSARGARLPTIRGTVPPPGARGPGCAFASRCPQALEQCRQSRPTFDKADATRGLACWNPVP